MKDHEYEEDIMTVEGRLARGEANYKAGKFLDNSETLEYVATLPKTETKTKEKKQDGKSKSG